MFLCSCDVRIPFIYTSATLLSLGASQLLGYPHDYMCDYDVACVVRAPISFAYNYQLLKCNWYYW